MHGILNSKTHKGDAYVGMANKVSARLLKTVAFINIYIHRKFEITKFLVVLYSMSRKNANKKWKTEKWNISPTGAIAKHTCILAQSTLPFD